MLARTVFRRSGAVPNCLCSHGKDWVFHYMNHPGVMAVSTLIEMKGVVRVRANFTQEQIEAMKEYDVELARKAQIAHDHGIAINFMDMERIEAHLPKLLKEKSQLEAARSEVLARKPGDYGPIKSAIDYCKPETYKLKLPEIYKKQIAAAK